METHAIISNIVYSLQLSLSFISTTRERKEDFASFARDAEIQNKKR